MKEFGRQLEDVGTSNKIKGDYFLGQKSRFLKNFGIIKNYLKKEDKILDVGTYPSYLLATLKRIGYNIEGVDLNPKREIDFIKKEKLKIKKCDIEKDKFPYKNNTFDKIILGEVFEHLYQNPIFALKEINRIMKKDGLLILTTPNAYSLKRVIHFFLGRGLGENPYNEFDKLNWAGHLGHIREYSKPELKFFLKEIGFRIEKVIFEYYGHKRFEKNRLIKSCLNVFYSLFPKFRPHIVIIARK